MTRKKTTRKIMKFLPKEYLRHYAGNLYDVWETRKEDLEVWEYEHGNIGTKIVTSHGMGRNGFPVEYDPNKDIGFATLSDGNVAWWFI